MGGLCPLLAAWSAARSGTFDVDWFTTSAAWPSPLEKGVEMRSGMLATDDWFWGSKISFGLYVSLGSHRNT